MATDGFTYGGPTLLSHPIFVEAVLPFLLIFALVFAVLEKSKLLGDGKRQIDAIVSLVTALIVISFANAVGIILQIIPFLAVSLVVLLVLMLLIGMTVKEGDFDKAFPGPFRIMITILVFIAVIIAMLWITGAWQYIYDWYYSSSADSNLLMNVIFIVVIIGAVALVLWKGKDKKES